MKFITVRDLRTSPRKVWEDLPKEREIVITNNGKPVALLTPISDRNLEETLANIRRVRAMEAVKQMQQISLETGNSRMTMEEINEEIFAEVTYHAAYEPQRAVRTRRWKYIRRYDERHRLVLPNFDDGPSKELWLRYGWGDRYLPQEELYDLIFDPNEAHNLAGDPAFAEVLEEMRGRLDRWMRATDDPLLHGPVPAPSGAELNDPDGLSHREPTWIVP